MKITELKLNPNNPRQIRGERLDQLKRSITGFERMMELRPLVVDEAGVVLGGNMRLRALKSLGYNDIPDTWVTRAVGLTEAEKLEFTVKDNSGFGEWDWDALANGWSELPLADWGVDIPADWAGATEAPALLTDADEVPDAESVETRCKAGDLWRLGRHRLLCGDSTKAADVARLMGGERAALIVTDPPYGVNYDGGTVVREKLKGDGAPSLYLPFLATAKQFCDPKVALYLWYADGDVAVSQAVSQAGFTVRNNLVWNKNQAQYGALSAQYKQKHEPFFYAHLRGQSPYWHGPTNEVTVWDCDRSGANEYHPTQKPVALFERAINNSSQRDDVLLDGFLGSGASLIAAELTGRRCYGVEISPKYCDVILARWENATGNKAELI